MKLQPLLATLVPVLPAVSFFLISSRSRVDNELINICSGHWHRQVDIKMEVKLGSSLSSMIPDCGQGAKDKFNKGPTSSVL